MQQDGPGVSSVHAAVLSLCVQQVAMFGSGSFACLCCAACLTGGGGGGVSVEHYLCLQGELNSVHVVLRKVSVSHRERAKLPLRISD